MPVTNHDSDADADADAADAADQDAETEPRGPSTRLAALLVVGGTFGLLAAMVLTIDRIRLLQDPNAVLACNISPFIACGPVMQSRAGELFGFPNPLLGIIGFSLVVTTGAALLARARLARWYWLGLQVGVALAAVFITWLQTQSLYVIHALCLWCILVWTVTIPIVVAITVHNLVAGHLGRRAARVGAVLSGYQITIVAVWYLVVLGAIALKFYREFALLWFGVAL